MFVFVVMIVTAAGAVRTMVMVMVMMFMLVMIVVVMMFMLVMVVVVVMMFMLVMVVVVVTVLMLIMVVVMVMVFMLLMVMVVVVMIVMCSLFKKLLELVIESILLCHSVNKLLACELVPLCSNDRSGRILLAEALYALVQLILRESACVAEDKAACIGYLIIEELAEILHIHLVLLCVNNCSEAVKLYVMSVDVLNSADNVAELANARGLDKDTVWSIVCKDLFQSLAEVSHETAADTARVHFGYLNTCVLQKTAVNAYLTKLVLDKHQLFALVALLN